MLMEDGSPAELLRDVLFVVLSMDAEAVEGQLVLGEVLAVAVVEVGVFADVVALLAILMVEAAESDLECRGHADGGKGQSQGVGEVDHGDGFWLLCGLERKVSGSE